MAGAPLNVLAVEPKFPGRLGAVCDWLVRKRGYRVSFFFNSAAPREFWPSSVGRGLELIQFQVGGVAREGTVAWTRHLERSLCYAYGAWEVIDARRIRPIDCVLGRSRGLGSTLFVPLAYPRTPIVNFLDYYYHPRAHDLMAEGEGGESLPIEYPQWRSSANAIDLLDLENGVVGWAPTEWQRALFPTEYRDDIFVLFDGVDARRFRPRDRGGSIEIAGKTLPAGALLVTFAADRPDWVRGVDRFVKVAARLIRSKPQIVCAIVGAGTVDRTLDVRHFGRDFLAECLATATISDDERLWRMGTLDPNTLAQLLAATDLYLDLGRDYSASRIVAEAMASGAPVLATDRPAIRDFIRHGETGCLCYSDPESDQIAEDALRLLEQPDERRALAVSARDDVERRFSHDATLPRLTEKLGGCVERSN